MKCGIVSFDDKENTLKLNLSNEDELINILICSADKYKTPYYCYTEESLFELRDKYSTLTKDSEVFGTKSAVQGEVDRLKKHISVLREKSGFTESEELKYKKLSARKSSLEKRLSLINKIVECNEQVISSSKLMTMTLVPLPALF